MKRYPISISSFKEIIEGNYIYVDKTALVYDLTLEYKYVFLNRPRRFGKTLLTSTLESYFLGEKSLFEGLNIDYQEKAWNKYPVLHFDFSSATYEDGQQLQRELNLKLLQYEEIYGKGEGEIDANQRLMGIIKRARQKANAPVVVLIDEYDKPLLDVMADNEKLKAIRLVMRNFYSPLKSCNDDLRFIFITGITKFSQLSIFSELNNLQNISMTPKFATICGITKEEMLAELKDGIKEMAKEEHISEEECMENLRNNYDGYHFSKNSPDIFNPFSLLQALQNQNTDPYWFTSATPTFLIQQMKKFGVSPLSLGRQRAWASSFDAPTEDMNSITPLLYQSGYLTIKDFDRTTQVYTLDIPNKEVREGLMNSLLPYVVGDDLQIPAQLLVSDMYTAFLKDDFDKVMQLLKSYLSTVPQTDNICKDYEGHYQSLLFVIFSLLCRYVQIEVRTPRGRADVVLESPKYIYIIELKLDRSSESALDQITLKDYSARFALSGKPTIKVGVNFSTETRNITDWIIE